MTYVAKTNPNNLTKLSTLATNDVVVLGDASDPVEIAKGITVSDLLTYLDANLTVGGHDPVTVTDSAEINFTLTGQDVTAVIVAGSIDESKLDTSVNASLDLADSASQPGHTHTASEITDFDTEVSNNAAVAANTAKVGVTTEEANPEVVSQAEAEAGTATDERIWTAERVKQAIDALSTGSGDVVGPASSVDNQVATFDSTTGKLIQSGGVVISGGNIGNGSDGFGAVRFANATGNTLAAAAGTTVLGIDEVTSAVNNLTATNSATGNAPSIKAEGTDTNIDINLIPKGTGELLVNGSPIATAGTQTINTEAAGNATLVVGEISTATAAVFNEVESNAASQTVTLAASTGAEVGKWYTIYCKSTSTDNMTIASTDTLVGDINLVVDNVINAVCTAVGTYTLIGGGTLANYSVVSSGSAAPATTPGKIGDIYVETTTPALYYASGVASSADWELVGGGGDVVTDLTPQLGGDLDVNGQEIVSVTANQNIVISPNGTGAVLINDSTKLTEDKDFTVVGDGFAVRDAASPTKGFRARFGGSTDFEFSGDALFSVWTGAYFTGTQHSMFKLGAGGEMEMQNSLTFADNEVKRLTYAGFNDTYGASGIGVRVNSGVMEAKDNTRNWTPIITKETRIDTDASSATPTPDADAGEQYNLTALAANATFGAPTGTLYDGQRLMIRILDDGTTRTLAYNAIYRAIGVTLPTATTANKTIYLSCVYNTADTKWDVIDVKEEA